MKYYIIAGEASGDLHGSNLMSALKTLDAEASFRCWGGDKMQAQGANLVQHYRDLAFMGFVEVVKNLRTILGLLTMCKKDIEESAPDVLILIDYPGFNLRIAKWAKSRGMKVVYYITPQIWAWHTSRIHSLVANTDLRLVILPFESAFFSKYGYEATFVGHPLLDAIQNFEPNKEFLLQNDIRLPYIALLPGSRKQEIEVNLPIMIEACATMEFTIVVACAPAIDITLYARVCKPYLGKVKINFIPNQTYDVLSRATVAIVGSGTATLETALFGIPQVVCYKGNKISYYIAKRLVTIPYISLVNLIANKEVVKELIQNEFTTENVRGEVSKLIRNSDQIKTDYTLLRQSLGDASASATAAKAIVDLCGANQ